MANKNFKAGIIITGDAKGGVKAIQATEKELKNLSNTSEKNAKKMKASFSDVNKSLYSMKAALGGVVAAIGVGTIAKAISDVTRETENFKAQLKTMTGSMDNASIAFDKLNQFAKTTPYTLKESIDGFVKLKALGLDPSERAMRSYGNTASAMGKSMQQMVEAVADASTNEFERLKEFGVKAKQQGDQVTFTFQGIETTIQKSSSNIEQYLMNIGESNFATAMADKMETVDGQLTNLEASLKDLWRIMGEGMNISGLLSNSISWLATQLDDAAIAVNYFFQNLKADEIADTRTEIQELAKELTTLEFSIDKYGQESYRANYKDKVDELNKLMMKWKQLNPVVEKVTSTLKANTDEINNNINAIKRNAKEILANNVNYSNVAHDMSLANINLADSINDFIDDSDKQQKTIKETITLFDEFADSIDKNFQSLFSDIFAGEADAFDNFLDRMKRSFTDMLAQMAYQAMIQPIMVNIVGAVSGALGLSGNNGAGGISNVASGVGTINTLTGGALLAGINASVAGALGVAATSAGVTMGGVAGAALAGEFALAGKGLMTIAMANPVTLALLALPLLAGLGDLFKDKNRPTNASISYGEKFDYFGELRAAEKSHGKERTDYGYYSQSRFGSLFGEIGDFGHDGQMSEADARELAKAMQAKLDVYASIDEKLISSLNLTDAQVKEIADNLKSDIRSVAEGGDISKGIKARYTEIFDVIGGEANELFGSLDGSIDNVLTTTMAFVTANDAEKKVYRELIDLHENNADAIAETITNFVSVNSMLEMIGSSSYSVSMAGFDAADALVAAAGGLENLSSLLGTFFNTFGTEAEKAKYYADIYAASIQALNERFNVNLSTKVADYKALVQAMLGAADASADLKIALLELTPVAAATLKAEEKKTVVVQQQTPVVQKATEAAKDYTQTIKDMIDDLKGIDDLDKAFRTISTIGKELGISNIEEMIVELEKLDKTFGDTTKTIEGMIVTDADVREALNNMSRDDLLSMYAEIVGRDLDELRKSFDNLDSYMIVKMIQTQNIAYKDQAEALKITTNETKDASEKHKQLADALKLVKDAQDDFIESMAELYYQLKGESVLDNTIRTINEIYKKYGMVADHTQMTTDELADFIKTLNYTDKATLEAKDDILELGKALIKLEQFIKDTQNTIDSILLSQRMTALDEQIDAAQKLYDIEKQRYDDAIAANELLIDYLKSLQISELNNQSPLEQMNAAAKLFSNAVSEGDAQDATQYAQEYLQFAQAFYASTGEYSSIFDNVNNLLNGMITNAGTDPEKSSTLKDLLSEKEALLEEQRLESLAKQNEDLIKALNDMALAKDVSLFDIAEQNGVDLEKLGLGLLGGLDRLNDSTVVSLAELAGRNEWSSQKLADMTGIDYERMILRLTEQGLTLKEIHDWDMIVAGKTSLTVEKMIELAALNKWSTETLANKYGTTTEQINAYLISIGWTMEQIKAWNESTLKGDNNKQIAELAKLNTTTAILKDNNASILAYTAGYGGRYSDNQWLDWIGTVHGTALEKIVFNTAQIAAALNKAPRYAQGTPYVPNDGLAYLHQGEAVIPAEYNQQLTNLGVSTNSVQSNKEVIAELKALREEVTELRKSNQKGNEINRYGFNKTIVQQTKIADSQQEIAERERING